MTIALLWPPEYETGFSCDLPLGVLQLRGFAIESNYTSITEPSGLGAAGGLQNGNSLETELPLGTLRLRTFGVTSRATANFMAEIPTASLQMRGFNSTAFVRYSEAREIEDCEAVALFISLLGAR